KNKLEPPHVGSYKINPAVHRDLREIDSIVGDLIKYFRGRAIQVVLLSEYGITNVSEPIHINRLLRQPRGPSLAVRVEELGRELLDPGASDVFAVADHQVAHIYLKEQSLEDRVRPYLEEIDGIAAV